MALLIYHLGLIFTGHIDNLVDLFGILTEKITGAAILSAFQLHWEKNLCKIFFFVLTKHFVVLTKHFVYVTKFLLI